MTINDKKKQVLDLLNSTDDSELIDEVYDILQPAVKTDEINIQQLPDKLQKKINIAIEDYKTGNYITHEEMKQKINQWLTK